MVAVGVVLLLLLSGLPTVAAHTVSGVPAAPGSPLAPTRPASPGPDSARASDSGPARSSLCLLGVIRSCAPLGGPAPARPEPSASGTPSSWTNITPPNGQPNPSGRALASLAYDPAVHATILFGGAVNGPELWENDTWEFTNNNWTLLVANSSCTPSTCPSAREDAMMAYDATLDGVVLFGGGISFLGFTRAYNDTWLFSGGVWRNLTAAAGAAPSPRLGSAMTWDPLDNDVVLFGGALANGVTLGDTWTFNGTWTNISASVSTTHPSPRAGMAIADSPSGYLLMFGGEGWNGTAANVLVDSTGSCVLPDVAWWFYADHWLHMNYGGVCPNLAGPNRISRPGVQAPGYPAPCGRVGASLGWSPKNERFVLYGGYGVANTQLTYTCSGPLGYLNDTYVYNNPPGNGFDWAFAGDSGDPSNRSYAAAAADLTDGYFILVGGTNGATALNSTFRYYALVHARLTGPTGIDTNSSHVGFNVPFQVAGSGGSGSLDYTFVVHGLRSSNGLVDGGTTDCANFTSSGTDYGPLPYDGIWRVDCQPSSSSYNVFRITLFVFDTTNSTLSSGVPVSGDFASANWTFSVLPPEIGIIYSQYAPDFYTNFSFHNVFSAYLSVAGTPAVSVTATLGGLPVSIQQRSSGSLWWDTASIDMGTVSGGSVLVVTGNWPGWTLNASYMPVMIETPTWLVTLFDFSGALQSITTSGAGPYNHSYAIQESYVWSLANSTSFAIPSPMISGNYSFIPSIEVDFGATSAGQLSLAGMLTFGLPNIHFGPATLNLTVAIGLSGKFVVLNASQGISDVQWVNAAATVQLAGDLGVSVPLYGFDILGLRVGFTLQIDLKPTLALSLLLLPTTDPGKDILPGLAVMDSLLVGALTVALDVAVTFGIGIASIAIGGALSIAVAFNITPTFHIGAGWINGTVFGQATFLWWSAYWNILGPAVIYQWTDPPPAEPRSGTACATCYDTGANATWAPLTRYYATTGYDVTVWNATATSGNAVQDIYPHTEVTAAPGPNGAYLFYTDDNPQLPVSQGLEVSGVGLNGSTNQLAALPRPTDPGFLISNPEATRLADGSLYVAWSALPVAEDGATTPAALTSLALHGARFYPDNGSWGPVNVWTHGGFAQSYRVDASGSSGVLEALVAPSYLVGPTTPEQLVEFDVGTGRTVANVSATGLSEVASLSGGAGEAVVLDVGGNYSILNLTTGAAVSFAPPVPAKSHLISAEFVADAPSTVALLYRSQHTTETILFDLATGQVLAQWRTGPDATTVHAIFGDGRYDVFASGHAGIFGWAVSGSTVANLTEIPLENVTSFGLTQDGASILVYSLVANSTTSAQPVVALEFAEAGSLLPAISAAPGTSAPTRSTAAGGTNYLLVLALAAAGVVALLAVVVVVTRRRGPPPTSAGPPPEGLVRQDSPPSPPPGTG
ncbi:MAG: hypothetical protein ACHQ16_02430 [Candidatus Lutacidiplasmatales archaeon]